MPHAITPQCTRCNNCLPECPVGAIKLIGNDYWIDPTLCNDCRDTHSQPQCVTICPTSSPIPLPSKKGRYKAEIHTLTSPDLFPNRRNHSFASAIVIWELCNILAQQASLPWQIDESGCLYYERQINQGRGTLRFYLNNTARADLSLPADQARSQLAAFDIRAACLNLIFAAHATALEKPWEEEFVISDRQIEDYLSLDKRKDLNKLTKLTLIKELAQQACQITACIHWSQQGKIRQFTTPCSRIWHLVEIQHHLQEDELGCKQLTGLTLTIRAGVWSQHFLNRQGYHNHHAFYQYGTLPKSLLTEVMSHWQQHQGAIRMMLWLLFKTKIGKEQRVTVPTLMRIAYGEERIIQATLKRDPRKRLLRTFESDLEVLNHYGLKPTFDPITYPPELQPLWAKLSELPDDAEAAIEFWINDGSHGSRLTDASPRGKWNRLMNARILQFDLPSDWHQTSTSEGKNRHTGKGTSRRSYQVKSAVISGEQIVTARKRLGWSQRELAERTGKSQSWIRDIENGRFRAKHKDQSLLRQVLEIAD